MEVGKSIVRVDAFDKVTGRTKYTDDLCDASAYVAKILHSTIAHGRVLSIDTTEAEKIEGVVKVVTCFDLGEYKNYFPTAGHPWSTDPGHQDVADRLLLTDEVKFYGDDIAAVVAENEVAANQAIRALKVEYEEYPVVTDVLEAIKDGAPQIHKNYPGNILKHTSISKGNYAEAIKEEGLTVVDRWYETPTVQHCHIENFICYAYAEGKRVTVVASTQIPHIGRRVVGQALGIPWGDVRIVKPYIGGGFGNKQDILYEPLCAFLSLKVGGHLVKLDCSREETFVANRVRHGIKFHIISHLRKDGTYAARKIEIFSNQGGYASHGHSIAAKGLGCFPQLYPCDNIEGDAYTVFTNRPVAGAMRGYGIPQAMFAVESHTEDVAKIMGIPSIEFRLKNLMPVGFKDGFSKNVNYYDTFRQCIEKGKAYMDYDNQLILTGKISEIGEQLTSNIKDSYRMGAELSGGVKVASWLDWNGHLTLSSNKIRNFTEYVDTYDANWNDLPQTSKNLGTTDIAFSPNLTFGSTFVFHWRGFSAAFMSSYVGRQYLDNTSSRQRSLDPYFVNDLRIGYTFRPRFMKEIGLDLNIRNLFNEMYETNGWTYSYILDGKRMTDSGYFAQAGTNMMARVTLKF